MTDRPRRKHLHNFIPALPLGLNGDGSARWWICDCGQKREFKADYAVTIGVSR